MREVKSKNFKNEVKYLAKQAGENPQHGQSLRLGKGDGGWTVFYCHQTKHYYAMNMASGECIQSSISSIYKAYRIDSKTGDAVISASENKPHLFAVKVFTGNKLQNEEMAKNETEALSENQFAELAYSAKGQPMIVMDYHPGEPLCSANGEPNHALLKSLTLAQRVSLIFQIAVQYNNIQKKSRLHVDVKGSNIVIDVARASAVVIDFGSSKKLTNDQISVPTGLMGLTPYAIPPEAVSKNKKAFIPTDDNIITGFLNSKSDIYGLGAVCYVILGATSPYHLRQAGIIAPNNFFAMQVLEKQIHAGFDATGILNSNIKKFDFGIRIGSQACGFRNFSTIEAPNDKTILQLKLPEFCYILYQDQLLYVDKAKVIGRKNTKPLPFQKSVEPILLIENTNELTEHHLHLCTSIANFHCFNEKPLDSLVDPLIELFLEQMVTKDHRQRPSMEEVLHFFRIANTLDAIVGTNNISSRDMIERQVNIVLLQLNLIVCKAWNIPGVSCFNFNLLEGDDELFDTFCQVVSKEDVLNGVEPLTDKHFQFLNQELKSDFSQSLSI